MLISNLKSTFLFENVFISILFASFMITYIPFVSCISLKKFEVAIEFLFNMENKSS